MAIGDAMAYHDVAMEGALTIWHFGVSLTSAVCVVLFINFTNEKIDNVIVMEIPMWWEFVREPKEIGFFICLCGILCYHLKQLEPEPKWPVSIVWLIGKALYGSSKFLKIAFSSYNK